MRREPLKVLYLEDDPHIFELVIMALEDDPTVDLKHFWSGRAAINAFATFAPDVLLLDVMLPDMGGEETLARIRALPGGKEVPAIFMTAKAQKHEQEEYLRQGAVGVIVKPFDMHTLGEQIRGLIDRADQTEALAPAV